jgi:hypothetical protein
MKAPTLPSRSNATGLGASWDVVAPGLGAQASPPVVTPDRVSGRFGRCAEGGAEFDVTADALQPDQPLDERRVVEIDGAACGTPLTLRAARAQAARFFPPLSGVTITRVDAIVYQSQPLIRLVPAAEFFRCQSLGSSAARLGRFSLRITAAGWKLAVGDCVNDKPPGSPDAGTQTTPR